MNCNACREQCPQDFDIPVYMKKMTDLIMQQKR
ncbi:hypothetical protein [Lacrimispora saccharolytica]|nr:hypothetical protein I6K70_11145 [Lacrimispora saccharolytica]